MLTNYTVNFPRDANNVSTTYWLAADCLLYRSTNTTILYLDNYSSNWRIIELLNDYSRLTNDWDQNNAIAPNTSAINQAKFLAFLLGKHGQGIMHAAPGPVGEIMLELRNKRDNRALEIIFYPNRSVIVFFPENEKPSQLPFRMEELPSHMEWLNERDPTYTRIL